MAALNSVFKRELKSFFVTPGGYIILAAFLLLSSYFFGTMLQYFQELVRVYNIQPLQMADAPPNLDSDIIQPYLAFLMLVLLICLPILCMRAIAEEKRSGTLELILTSQISTRAIVMAKFLALSIWVGLMLSLAAWCPVLLSFFGTVDLQAFFVALVGLQLYASALIAIILAVSVFCSSALLSAFSSMVVILLLYMLDASAGAVNTGVGLILRYLTPRAHLEAFLQGTFVSVDLIYFLSLMVFGIWLGGVALQFERCRR